jgi:hypothetical protein
MAVVLVLVMLPLFTVLEVARQYPQRSATQAIGESDLSPSASAQRFAEGDTTAMFPALALQMMTEGETWTQQPGHLPLSIIARPIPRSVWPNKPLSNTDELYSRFFPDYYTYNRAGTAFTLVSDFYFDSGIPAVVLGMALVGWLYARLWEWLRAVPEDRWRWALYGPTFAMSTLLIRGDVALCFGISIFVFGPALAGWWLAGRSRTAPRRAPEAPPISLPTP